MKIFEGVAVPTSWFVLPLFLIRTFYAQISGDSGEIRAALKGVLLYFLLIASFGVILDLILQIPQSFLPDFSSNVVTNKIDTLTQNETSKFEAIFKSSPQILIYIMEGLLAILYWAMMTLHILVMILLSSMAPIIFLLSCVLNIGVPVRIFFGLIIMSSTWPVMWYGFDQGFTFIEKVIPDQFGKIVLELLITIIKGIGPLSLAYMSLSSGPGKAITSAAAKGLGFASGASSSLGEKSMGVAKSIPIKSALNGFKSRTNGLMSSLKRIGNNGLNNNSENSEINNKLNPQEANQTENAESSKENSIQRTQPQEIDSIAEKQENLGPKILNSPSISSECPSGIESSIQSVNQSGVPSDVSSTNVSQSDAKLPDEQVDLPMDSAKQSQNVKDQSSGNIANDINFSERSNHKGSSRKSISQTLSESGGLNIDELSHLNLSEYPGFSCEELKILNRKFNSNKS
ncbi:MAG TPA: hypothetical protein PLJ21_06860 [Pseudobdellovibrionaceae bacterium]|nr:hypothetical protein [Pseudobdellovibrionaceae bacterium]